MYRPPQANQQGIRAPENMMKSDHGTADDNSYADQWVGKVVKHQIRNYQVLVNIGGKDYALAHSQAQCGVTLRRGPNYSVVVC